MVFFKKLSVKVRLAAAIGTTLLAAGAAVPAAYASTASHAAVSNTVASRCVGHPHKVADHNHEREVVYYDTGGCVGTVKVTAFAAVAGTCVTDAEVRVYSNGHLVNRKFKTFGAIDCDSTPVFIGIHHRYPGTVSVCARSAATSNPPGRLGPACTKIN